MIVKVHVRAGGPADEVDLDTLTPKARAFAEAVSMSSGHRPLGVLCDTGRLKGDGPNFRTLGGHTAAADAEAADPDLRFISNLAPIPRHSDTTAEEWLEYNARQMPYTSWPIAGARSRIEPLTERVPSAEAAREDRCLTRDQSLRYLADRGAPIGPGAWVPLQKAGNVPPPHHFAVGGRMPLWHVDDLSAYAQRPRERWPISRVADHLGYSGASATGSARKQLHRWDLVPEGREPERGGESLYAADQVQIMQAARPGQGRRTDLAR
ncbi:hypothetical protein [Streptomyces sp. NRRL S-1868]|uniref:hypothetical protein n=1 Tax=Streptomyces sp. NRRL S-1868 TaxID=1463892 RepID=UPI000689C095|nr:hypothetical protein [Streptomyces sp. NRRL S-1868]